MSWLVWVFADPESYSEPSRRPTLYRQKGEPGVALFADCPEHSGRILEDVEADPITFVPQAWAVLRTLVRRSSDVLMYAHHADNTIGARLGSVESSAPRSLSLGSAFKPATLYRIANGGERT